MYLIILFLVSYLLGSLPYGLILVKVFKGIDIRTIGSKNIGATNVLRAGYPILAIFTVLFDGLKGALAVLIFKYLYVQESSIPYFVIAGMVAMLGHIFPVWLNFKGGKGVATAFGTILAINPILGLLCLLTWLLVAVFSKYSSLSAIISFTALPIFTFFLETQATIYLLVVSLVVLIKHKDNFIRLYKKQETKIKFKK
jgi:glycerol-3-phosphate acyltransferase PlsY